jgi:type II secretion system protein C
MKMYFFKKSGLNLIFFFLLGFSFISAAFSSQIAIPPQEQGSTLPPLSLVGVVVSKDASSSIAILKNEQTGSIKILRVGENILDFTLSQVLDNMVVLRKGEQTYKIFLGRGRLARAMEPPKKKPVEVPPPAPEDMPVESRRPSSNIIRMEFNRDEMEKRLEEELPLIMKDARFVPNMVEGRVIGFRITRLPSKSILSEVGIRRNDVVMKINDVELNSVEGMLDLYMKFKNENRFEVTIERRGKILRIQYILK